MARSRPGPTYDAATIDAALEAATADDLRAAIRSLLPWLDDGHRAQLARELVGRAARSATGWTPPAPDERHVAAIEAFAAAAEQEGYAVPAEVDGYLTEGTNAFLAKDYLAACRIFRALLVPICSGDIDLGQHEEVDDVLVVDAAACVTQYAVASYMTAAPDDRAEAVLSAIDDVGHRRSRSCSAAAGARRQPLPPER